MYFCKIWRGKCKKKRKIRHKRVSESQSPGPTRKPRRTKSRPTEKNPTSSSLLRRRRRGLLVTSRFAGNRGEGIFEEKEAAAASRGPSPGSAWRGSMFTNAQRQVERTGRSGTPRNQYLQVLAVPLPSFIPQEFARNWGWNLPCNPFSRLLIRSV